MSENKQVGLGICAVVCVIGLLAWLTMPHHRLPQVYDCVLTRDRLIGPDEVREYRVLRMKKQGWLTSDRYILVLEDGSVVQVNGNWDAVLTPVQEETDGSTDLR